ncbi:hypothetical protein MKZ38_006521 [Zalerion maritima]|uniref:Uncharacterized protein n=1 Tax=Zalerion maritima TaxID=339359 RepID=A0AAD5WW56_9PEZI|nr:hypothetical protein MKZ38_006521 [Zalerion maritima]
MSSSSHGSNSNSNSNGPKRGNSGSNGKPGRYIPTLDLPSFFSVLEATCGRSRPMDADEVRRYHAGAARRAVAGAAIKDDVKGGAKQRWERLGEWMRRNGGDGGSGGALGGGYGFGPGGACFVEVGGGRRNGGDEGKRGKGEGEGEGEGGGEDNKKGDGEGRKKD